MKLQFLRVLFATMLVVTITGCASQGGRPSNGIDPSALSSAAYSVAALRPSSASRLAR